MIQSSQKSLHTRATVCLLLVSVVLTSFTGCSRRFWRQQAEADTYHAIAEKQNDERWLLPRVDLQPDQRSRFYDPYDPDCIPLPPDDPAAHQFMHCSNGKEGYKGWHKYGDTLSVENPHWLDPYAHLLTPGDPTTSHRDVEIPMVTLKDAIALTHIHSREFQSQLEDVYLQALALTEQRYELGLKFLIGGGGSGTAGALFSSAYKQNAPIGSRSTQVIRSGLGVTQQLATGTQLSLELLNAFTWRLGPDGGNITGLAWSVTQPLLNQAGRKVVLEALTQAERTLLYEVRNMARFRQTIFTDVAADYLRLQQQAQIIVNQQNNIRLLERQIEAGQVTDSFRPFTVREELGDLNEAIPESLSEKLKYDDTTLSWSGPMSDDEQAQLLAISEDSKFQAAAEQLISFRKNEVVSLGVLQLTNDLNNAQSTLIAARLRLADSLDRFKIRLGLPPNIEMTLDDSFRVPFVLIDTKLSLLEDSLNEFAKSLGPSLIPAPQGRGAERRQPPEFEELRAYVAQLATLRDQVRDVALAPVNEDFEPIRQILKITSDENLVNPNGRSFGTVEERQRVIRDVTRDLRNYRFNEQDFQQWDRATSLLSSLTKGESADDLFKSMDNDGDGILSASEFPMGWNDLPRIKKLDRKARLAEKLKPPEFVGALRDSAIAIREELLKMVRSLEVVQAGLRGEAIALNRFTLPGRQDVPTIDEVIEVGLANRHDLMNARGVVMDARRALEVAANALKAKLDVNVSGSNRLHRGSNDTVDVSVDFKTPLDQVAERNDYNTALIAYQRARRTYMAAEDNIKRDIRIAWRALEVSQQRLEIDRQTARNAALEYDNVTIGTRQDSLSLSRALNTVLRAENALVNDWVSYETNRLNIYRDMGIMQIDEDGVWDDEFYQRDVQPESSPLPDSTILAPELQPNIPFAPNPAPPANAPPDAVLNLPENPNQ